MTSDNITFLASSIIESLNILSNDFDSFGLPIVNITNSVNNVIMQLVDNTNLLIQQYRKSLAQMSNLNMSMLEMQSRNTNINKVVNRYENEIEEKENSLCRMQERLIKSDLHLERLEKENNELKKNVALLKKQSKTKEENFEHQIKKLIIEKTELQEQLTKRVGVYTSTNKIIPEEIQKYKAKEEIYQETILNLQKNNTALLEEILNLKEEVVEMIRNKT